VAVRLEALQPSVFEPQLLFRPIAPERREPHADERLVAGRGIPKRQEAAGKRGAEPPQRLRIVPPVVEDQGIEPNTPLFDQLAAEEVDCLQAFRLREAAVLPRDVVPGVIVQQWPIGLRPLALDIIEKSAPHLAGRRYADN